MKMFQTQRDFSRIESGSTLRKSRRAAHVVNVKFQITSVHDGQHKAESILGLECVC